MIQEAGYFIPEVSTVKKILLKLIFIFLILYWLFYTFGIVFFLGLPLVIIDIFQDDAREYLCGPNVCTDSQYIGYILWVIGQILMIIVPAILLIYLLVRRRRKKEAK
ncbi:hypothetical protein [Bacillus sp. V5-8f]|uniref:hypothetical protein n=1 Tax=Bacillus sp. V5-8f TaxID=2053044 RepID=UPI000C782281|nr:hypothetical protein [Bacillus sp. V5-8f]PLT32799.1 hypothetical protein CUU64_16755 [Bacillus sp. V5-8f]